MPVDKKLIMNLLIKQLEANLEMLVQSALEAKQAATSEESKPENKYDTRGLEASYLAGAQAERSLKIQNEIDQLRRFVLRDYSNTTSIDLTALIEVKLNSEVIKTFFLLPFAGGTKLELNNSSYLVLTPVSPVGHHLVGKVVGDSFLIKNKGIDSEYEIIKVY